MRKIRELLRLRWEHHLPQRAISQSLRLSQASVSDYLNRAPARVNLDYHIEIAKHFYSVPFRLLRQEVE